MVWDEMICGSICLRPSRTFAGTKPNFRRNQGPRYLLRRCVHRSQVEEKFANKNSEMRTNKIEKRIVHFKCTFTTIPRFSDILKYSQTMRACLSQYLRAFLDRLFMCSLRRVEAESPAFAYAVRISSMILRSARFAEPQRTALFVSAADAVQGLSVALAVQF